MEGESETVELHVFGLRTVVSKPVTARADLNWTWYHFLNEVCGIKVGPKDAVMACTTSYSAVTKRGWCADLSEKIRVFVEKYSLKRDRYSVRLMMQFTNSNSDQSVNTTVTVNENDLFNSDSSEMMNTSNNKRASTRRTRSSINSNVTESVYTSPSHANEVEDDNLMNANMIGTFESENDQEDERPDDLMESPPAPRAGHSKRKSGTQNEDLKVLIKSRVRKLGNPFLLKVQKEIQKLQRNQIWYRNVQYAPLASYLLQEVFADK